MRRMPITLLCALMIVWLWGCSAPSARPPTDLERNNYRQLPTSAEIDAFLDRLSETSPLAEVVSLGTSALGAPINGLLVSRDVERFRDGTTSAEAITMLLVGSQHGSEPSGAEALLVIARDLVGGNLQPLLEEGNFIFIPNSNPDGRDRNRRVNGNGANLSTNFTTLTEPEARAVMYALHRWEPQVILDVHESAALKKKSLGRQGYVIDFEAQFEGANNPNVDAEIRSLTYEHLLPEVIEKVQSQGLSAQRYIGEITDINQPITHGGLSLRNIRNMAGMMGTFSFLLENTLDPSTGTYPTPRNIKARVEKQYLCIAALMDCCITSRADIVSICEKVRRQWQGPDDTKPLLRGYAYQKRSHNGYIDLPLRIVTSGEKIIHRFRYYGSIAGSDPLPLPAAYIVTANQGELQPLLDRHRIQYQTISHTETRTVTVQHIVARQWIVSDTKQAAYTYSTEKRSTSYHLQPGDLMIPLDQPARRIIPLLLEPTSMSSAFNAKEYSPLVKEQADFFIYRVP